MTPWETLDVAPDVASGDLRRRYAALIKAFRPETHPQDFARIRAAYEIALKHARQREALATREDAPTPPAIAEPEPFDAVDAGAPAAAVTDDDADPVPIEDEIALADAPVADVLTQPARQDVEPRLAELFQQFHALAESAVGTRDLAALPALQALLRARTRSTLDDSQALEFALLRWLLEAEMPALTLLFETGRAFGWHGHESRLAVWLSPHAQRRMEGLLSLSRDLVFARHFSGNAWLRRLHDGGRTLPAWRPSTVDALRWAARWQATSEGIGTPLATCLDARTLMRLRGFTTYSTDVLVGVLAATTASDLGDAGVRAVAVTVLSSWLRRAWLLASQSARTRRLHRPLAWAAANVFKIALAGGAVLAVGAVLLVASDNEPLVAPIAVALAPVAALLMLWLCWRVLAFLEVAASQAFASREAVNRLEFKRLLAKPFVVNDVGAARLGLVARLKAIPEARRLESQEVAAGARPPRAKVGLAFGRGMQGQRWPRLLWIGLWIAFGAARVLHLIGSSP